MDDEVCLQDPVRYRCKSLDFVLTFLLTNEVYMIDTIYVLSHPTNSTEQTINVQMESSGTFQRQINIKCLQSCTMIMSILISFQENSNKFSLKFENLNFQDSIVVLSNVFVHFHFVSFLRTQISNVEQSWSSPHGELQMTLSAISFEQSSIGYKPETTGQALSPNKRTNKNFIANLYLINSIVLNSSIFVSTHFVLLSLKNTTITDTALDFSAHVFLKGTFDQVAITSNQSSNEKTSLTSATMDVEMSNIFIFNTTQGIEFVKTFSGKIESWLQIKIFSSTFADNEKSGRGAAMKVVVNAPAPQSHNHILIANCSFTRNVVHRKDSIASFGGAIYLDIDSDPLSSFTGVLIEVTESLFLDNYAEDGGGAIYLSKGKAKLLVSNCTFKISRADFASPGSVFVLALSDIFMYTVHFSYDGIAEDEPLFDLEMSSVFSLITIAETTVRCSYWYTTEAVKEFKFSPRTNDKILQRYSLKCGPCPPSFYWPTDGMYKIRYFTNMTDVLVKDWKGVVKGSSCISCPYGGDCTDSTLKSKPNFWGHKYLGDFSFLQCPTGYCCTGNKDHLCSSYNSCLGHRTGPLCGSCLPQHSLSVLSNKCIENHKCSIQNFWLISLVSTTAYMLWYTFKDDVVRSPAILYQHYKSKSKKPWPDSSVDKGYFGILIYFVQAAGTMKLYIDTESDAPAIQTIKRIENCVGLVLNMELSYFPQDYCVFEGLDMTSKTVLGFAYLFGTYVSWAAAFFGLKLIRYMKRHHLVRTDVFMQLDQRFVRGLVEIVKYTYAGFTFKAFMSLTCVQLGRSQVWKFDGMITCFSWWQIVMIVFCGIYVVPFPLMLIFGQQQLTKGAISHTHFFCGCIFPLPCLLIWAKMTYSTRNNPSVFPQNAHTDIRKETSVKIPSMSRQVLLTLQGPYRSSNDVSLYWESVMVLRRLMLGATTLIPNAVVQISVCLVLCSVFLVHHTHKQPFTFLVSNRAETFSLVMLNFVGIINLYKAFYINQGNAPEGPNLFIMIVLQLIENLFVTFLIFFIAAYELKLYCSKKYQMRTKQKPLK